MDIGAGVGNHSIELQKRNIDVTAIDNSEYAVEIMKKRGVINANVGDLYDCYSKKFDTVLIMLGIGICGDLEGVETFLRFLPNILSENGQLLTDSFDVRGNTGDESYEKYKLNKIESGKYFGERTIRFHYKEKVSDWIEWIHIDPEEFRKIVLKVGLKYELLMHEGRYLVRITK